jgi:glycosyltransferase involved in cell wall biosynthesis
MHIQFLLTQDLESPSGLGRYYPLAKELVKLGYKVSIAALHSNFDALKQTNFEYSGIQVDYVAPMHVKKTGDTKSYYSSTELMMVVPKATLALSKKALETNADIIHIAKPHPMNSIAGLLAKYLRNKPLFLDCDDYEAGSGKFRKKWQRKGIAFFEQYVPRQAVLVSTNTMFMHNNLTSWGVSPDQILYLPNGVDRERFIPPDHELVEALRKELMLDDKKVVAYIGTLSLVSHPVDLLINAFKIVNKRISNSVLLLVGGGEDIDHLRKLVSDKGLFGSVRFCGRVAPDSIPIYYALAHVSVDPVYDDTVACGRSPLKLFESWVCKVPFVTADVGDRRQLFGNPMAGVLAEPGDVNSLAQRIIQVLDEQNNPIELINLGQERVENYYWDRLVKDLESEYLKRVL